MNAVGQAHQVSLLPIRPVEDGRDDSRLMLSLRHRRQHFIMKGMLASEGAVNARSASVHGGVTLSRSVRALSALFSRRSPQVVADR